MRRFFFSLLILLTAFRGVVGDAMAYEMSAGKAERLAASFNATEFIASHADSMRLNQHFSSEMHAAIPCHSAAEDTPQQATSHDCNACQVCHSPALQRLSAMTHLVPAPAAYAERKDRVWLSADIARLQKPPVF